MSRTDARRPIRFLAVSELVPLAPQSQSDNHVAMAQSADRFRRTLSAPLRRGSITSPSTAPAAPRESSAGNTSTTNSAQSGRAPDTPQRAGTAPTRSAKDTQAVLRAAPLQAASPAFSAEEEEPDRVDDAEALGTGAALTTAEDAWPDQMAKMIAELCTRADSAFVTWTVTVPMDPHVLPDTELRLHLSPHWLSLRFATQSQRAARLISLHRPKLQSQLEHMANLPHGIDIEVI